MECEMDEMRMKLGKKDLQITQIECENKVLKKMIRKYEDLVHGLRVKVAFSQITSDMEVVPLRDQTKSLKVNFF